MNGKNIYEKTIQDVFWLNHGFDISIINAILTVLVGLLSFLKNTRPLR